MLSRNEDLQRLLEAAREWDLVVCDEAHRMSASFFGTEIKYTKRYRLGQLLGARCRHFLLMTATPHNGKEEDFQLFMSLLDPDRFEGRFRDRVHQCDASDMLRRLTKEELLRFDGRPLFPERRAHTAQYELSEGESDLYEAVTTYVREEMDRAERFAPRDEPRRQNVGFALQILQRRLASSPAAIHESLRRRRERLEDRLTQVKRDGSGRGLDALLADPASVADLDFDDLEDASEEEIERTEARVLGRATTAQTIAELDAELETLKRLESRAQERRRDATDTKWLQLAGILDHPLMTDAGGDRRKLIVFTEPRDTLEYLAEKIRMRLGRPEAVVVIHGGAGRQERWKAVEAFMHDPSVVVMVANDAAGEGVNLQRAHLMVNYDLPWNPNRLEQRFGRIHRIGQAEVCHLWNLVAQDTREGEVYGRLLEKLETARAALGGRVYDVLGRLFQGAEMRDLLMDAIRYGERPETKARLFERVGGAVDRERLLALLEDRALVRDQLSAAEVDRIREEMERAEARRLQPHYIESFFLQAFRHLGGAVHRREAGRYEVTRVPGPVRKRGSQTGRAGPILERYERVCFEKSKISGSPAAVCLAPGHPLLDATVDLVLDRHRDVLAQGAVLADDTDDSEALRVLFHLETAVRDGRERRPGHPLVVSRRLRFVEVTADGEARDAGPAPYLDYRPVGDEERALVAAWLEADWASSGLEDRVMTYARQRLVPNHAEDIRSRRLPEIDRVESQVVVRLKREIVFWDNRAVRLRHEEKAGKAGGSVNATQAEARANGLAERLERRRVELAKERDISPLPPAIRGRALVVPLGFLRRHTGPRVVPPGVRETTIEGRKAVERLAMSAVMAAERALGHEPHDVSAAKVGYDIESREAGTGRLRFIEVKGRIDDADTVTVTHQEIRTALNKPDAWILALVLVKDGYARRPRYLRRPFRAEPDFEAVSVTYNLRDLLARAEAPR